MKHKSIITIVLCAVICSVFATGCGDDGTITVNTPTQSVTESTHASDSTVGSTEGTTNNKKPTLLQAAARVIHRTNRVRPRPRITHRRMTLKSHPRRNHLRVIRHKPRSLTSLTHLRLQSLTNRRPNRRRSLHQNLSLNLLRSLPLNRHSILTHG